MKRVVVTGASGYIGAPTVAELLRHQDLFSVVTAGRRESGENLCEHVSFDLLLDSDDKGLYKRLGCPDICLHLAWRDGFQHNAMSHLHDLPYHFAFLRNLADHGTKQFAVAGSFREYGKVCGKVDPNKPVVADNLYSLAKGTLKTALEIYFAGGDFCLQWLRPFTVYGHDEKNHSIMSKIIQWEKEGKKSFPFTDGNEEYDYIHVDDLAKQITAILSQTEVTGVIDCCSGRPTRLGDMIETFLSDNHYSIRPEYGAFQSRGYDSSVIYGDRSKIDQILRKSDLYGGIEI